MKKVSYDKEVFELMVQDWLADNADEMSDLVISNKVEWDEDMGWYMSAEDSKHSYTLSDDGTGNILIDSSLKAKSGCSMSKRAIKLTQDPYLCSGSDIRITDEQGNDTNEVIYTPCYTASATDDKGNDYTVYWVITDRAAFDDGDEDCCDWDSPTMVLDDRQRNLTEVVDLES